MMVRMSKPWGDGHGFSGLRFDGELESEVSEGSVKLSVYAAY